MYRKVLYTVLAISICLSLSAITPLYVTAEDVFMCMAQVDLILQ